MSTHDTSSSNALSAAHQTKHLMSRSASKYEKMLSVGREQTSSRGYREHRLKSTQEDFPVDLVEESDWVQRSVRASDYGQDESALTGNPATDGHVE